MIAAKAFFFAQARNLMVSHCERPPVSTGHLGITMEA